MDRFDLMVGQMLGVPCEVPKRAKRQTCRVVRFKAPVKPMPELAEFDAELDTPRSFARKKAQNAKS